jgi:hypothetical protein
MGKTITGGGRMGGMEPSATKLWLYGLWNSTAELGSSVALIATWFVSQCEFSDVFLLKEKYAKIC